MRIIGITGGVGAGKSEILKFIAEQYSSRIIMADDVANEIKMPGQLCYNQIVALLGKDILQADGTIDRAKMAAKIFADKELLKKTNEILHPGVRTYILHAIEEEKKRGEIAFLIIEAALLIEEHYDEICDELWYIHADYDVRCERLKNSRGYTQEKIDSIMAKQLSETEFKKHCQVVIDNSGKLKTAYAQIREKLEA